MWNKCFGRRKRTTIFCTAPPKLPEAAPRRRKCITVFCTAPPKLPEAAPRRSPESWGGVAERSAFGGLASSKVGLLKILKILAPSEEFETIKGVRAVSSRINPSEQYIWFDVPNKKLGIRFPNRFCRRASRDSSRSRRRGGRDDSCSR